MATPTPLFRRSDRLPYALALLTGCAQLTQVRAIADPVITRNRGGGEEKYSLALDFAPYVNGGIDWKDERAFALVAGVWMSCAKSLGHTLRWGADWNGDGSTMDQSFMDVGHLELVA